MQPLIIKAQSNFFMILKEKLLQNKKYCINFRENTNKRKFKLNKFHSEFLLWKIYNYAYQSKSNYSMKRFHRIAMV